MKMHRIAVAGFLALGLVVSAPLAADKLTSGPQPGNKVPGPFHPLNVTGEKAGEKHCLYCQNGTNPVAMIFARQPSQALTKLIKKIDETIAKIDVGEYGYCDSCGVEIGLKRLEARPTATLCIDCKTLDELRERQVAK